MAVLWDGGGIDDLWTTAENWVGDVLPGSGDSTRPTINDPSVSQPLVDFTVTANNTHTRIVVGADNGPVSLTMTGGSLTGTDYFIAGWEVGGVGTMNMSGGSLNVGGNCLVGGRGTGTFNLSGGDMTVDDRLFLGEEYGAGTLNISGGSIFVNNYLSLARSGGTGNSGVVNMTGGDIDAYCLYMGTGAGPGQINLYGGLISLRSDTIDVGANGLIDITEGMLRLPGDQTDPGTALMQAISANRIIGYGGAGTVLVNFVPGDHTEVTAIPEPATIALLGIGGLALLRRRRS